MAAAVPIGPACPDCAGGGEINGVECPACEGSTRLRVVPRRRRAWRKRLLKLADAVATPAGTLVGWSVNLPGLAGAAAVSYGAAAVAHGAWHAIPELGAALLVAGVFGLMADRRL